MNEQTSLPEEPLTDGYQVELANADISQMTRIGQAANHLLEAMARAEASLGEIYAVEWMDALSRVQRKVIRGELQAVREQIARAKVEGEGGDRNG